MFIKLIVFLLISTLYVNFSTAIYALDHTLVPEQELKTAGFNKYESINPNLLIFPVKQIIEKIKLTLIYNKEDKTKYQYILLDKNVIYSIRGPRQVGKTTLIKIIIRELLEKNNITNIMYFSCDLIKDNVALNDLLNTYHAWIKTLNQDRIFIFLDEISSVKDWQKSIKLFIDITGNNNITIVLTGSHTIDIKNSTERLPGRVGEKEHIPSHKVLLPMKFAEYVQLRKPELYKQVKKFKLDIAEERSKQFLELVKGTIPSSANNLIRILPELDILLDEYLITGGIMIAVNEYTEHKRINAQIYDLYIRHLNILN